MCPLNTAELRAFYKRVCVCQHPPCRHTHTALFIYGGSSMMIITQDSRMTARWNMSPRETAQYRPSQQTASYSASPQPCALFFLGTARLDQITMTLKPHSIQLSISTLSIKHLYNSYYKPPRYYQLFATCLLQDACQLLCYTLFKCPASALPLFPALRCVHCDDTGDAVCCAVPYWHRRDAAMSTCVKNVTGWNCKLWPLEGVLLPHRHEPALHCIQQNVEVYYTVTDITSFFQLLQQIHKFGILSVHILSIHKSPFPFWAYLWRLCTATQEHVQSITTAQHTMNALYKIVIKNKTKIKKI